MTDRPIARPVASFCSSAQPPRDGLFGGTSAGNTPRDTTPRRAAAGSGRVGRRQLQQLATQLSERDWAVLRSVAEHRFLTTRHVKQLHFAAHATPAASGRSCRRVLERLRAQRVLRSLERRIGGVRAGSAGYVWTTDAVGRRLLDSEATTRRRHQEPSERFLAHALAIADTHLTLVAAGRRHALELLAVELEPGCWRSYTAPDGSRAVLQPDLAVSIGAGDFEDAWFVEVDLGSEHIPTLLRKCRQYGDYRRTGTEQQRYGGFPRVLWLLSTTARVDAFQAALHESRTLDRDLFVTATPAELVAVVTTTNNHSKGGDA